MRTRRLWQNQKKKKMNHTVHAMGIACGRLNSSLTSGEVARFLELHRTALQLENACLIAMMELVQPLLITMEHSWRLSMTLALIVGTKMTTEGFYTSDLLVCSAFNLSTLLAGERFLLRSLDWRVTSNLLSFRSALTHVALECPHVASAKLLVEEPVLHVLVVGGTTQNNRAIASFFVSFPRVEVQHRTSVEEALQMCHEMHLVVVSGSIASTRTFGERCRVFCETCPMLVYCSSSPLFLRDDGSWRSFDTVLVPPMTCAKASVLVDLARY